MPQQDKVASCFPILLVCYCMLMFGQAAAKINLVDSPYYLPEVTDDVETFAAIPGQSNATAFRVMGAPEGPHAGMHLALNWMQALAACQDVGMGLAAILDEPRKAALDRLIARANVTAPDSVTFSRACETCGGFTWVGGLRVNLTGSLCTGNGGVYPYGTIQSNGSFLYGEVCGTDPADGWAWIISNDMTADNDTDTTELMWSEFPYGSQLWRTSALTGLRDPDGHGDQPSGWNPTGQEYENCTATQMLTWDMFPGGDGSSPLINTTVLHDFGCGAPLARWVCEFEDASQGVSDKMSDPMRNNPAATAANSFYSLPGVTEIAVETGSGDEVLRVMGATAEKGKALANNQSQGANGTLTWKDAQNICTWSGGTGLLAKQPARDGALADLLSQVALKLPQGQPRIYWLGQVYDGDGSDITAPSSWRSYPDWKYDLAKSSAAFVDADSWLFEPQSQYPLVSAATLDPEGDPSSCAASSRAGYLDSPVNRVCDGDGVSLFVCAFANDTAGFGGTAKLDDDDDDVPVGAIVGGVIAGLALVACCALLLVFLLRRKRSAQHKELQTKTTAVSEPVDGSVRIQVHAMPGSDRSTALNPSTLASSVGTWSSKHPTKSTNDSMPGSTLASIADPTLVGSASTSSTGRRRIQGGPDTSAFKQEVHAMLDSYIKSRQLFGADYRLLPGSENRREGGQGVVVFAERVLGRGLWAIKFFAHQRHFEEECSVYHNEDLHTVLPEIDAIVNNANESMVSPNGVLVPSFVVVSAGQPFDEWVASMTPDFPLALQVLFHVGKKLQQIHAAGYAHRDVKPSNVILESLTKQWVLIDFATAAPIGKQSHIACTLRYAAPEVACALKAEDKTMLVSGAVDVWSLGLMAWTLLTKTQVFEHTSYDELMDKLTGEQPLPWETKLSQETRAQLGILLPSVRAMLARDPSQRPTMNELLKTWQSTFQSSQTTTEFA